MPQPLDCLILGGGVAGLWTLRTLLAEGYHAALIESHALGSAQTIASQGILHSGTKYALGGDAAAASRAAADAAAVWRGCLKPPEAASPPLLDLSSVRLLSRQTFLFSTPGVASRLSALAASKALTIGPRRLERERRPPVFGTAPASVDVYALDEPVLDGPSLLRSLAGPAADRLVLCPEVSIDCDEGGVTIRCAGAPGELRTRALVLAAGAGNEPLLERLGLAPRIRMQRRPLHMVMARGDLPELYAHCVTLSDKPRATITTATDGRGRRVWYVGGQIAEAGVDRPRDEQIGAAERELREILPWIDVGAAEWAAFTIDRAEGFDARARRPDTPVVHAAGPVIACWPTKLVLAPLAARGVLAAIRALGVSPSGAPAGAFEGPRPPIATAPWDREDLAWS